MTGGRALVWQSGQDVEAPAPFRQVGRGRARRAVMEQQVAADQCARGHVEQREVGAAVARQRDQRGNVIAATDPEARLLTVPRSKGDSEGEGATAFLSPRTVHAVEAWAAAAVIAAGPLLRRRSAASTRRARGCPRSNCRRLRDIWDLRKTLPKPAVPARTEYSVGEAAFHSGSIGPIWRATICRAFARGALPYPTKWGSHPLAQPDQRPLHPGRSEPGSVCQR